MLFPKKTKYKKQFKGKLVGKTTKGNKIIFGKYAIKVLEEARLTAIKIVATRRTNVRKMSRLGFLCISVFPGRTVTSKLTEKRMGKGKGACSFSVAKVKKGQILYEISVISLENAKKVLRGGSNKLRVKPKFIYK